MNSAADSVALCPSFGEGEPPTVCVWSPFEAKEKVQGSMPLKIFRVRPE